MELEKQVCSVGLSRKLKELGVKQESLFYWSLRYSKEEKALRRWLLLFGKQKTTNGFLIKETISAFTVAELGEMLKNRHLPARDKNNNWFFGGLDTFEDYFEKTEANARAKMFIYLKENNLT